jgi:putative MFS transporter
MAAWLVERWGRKPVCVVTLLGGGVMAFSMGRVRCLAAMSRC